MLSDERAVTDRAFQIIVGFVALTASAAAQGEAPVAPGKTSDARSSIFAEQPAVPAGLPAPDPETMRRSIASAGDTETGFGTPALSSGATSSYILSAIAAGLPKYNASAPEFGLAPEETNLAGRAFPPKPGVASLPAFIVRDARIPTRDQILTPKARAEITMDKYLGPSDGLDRGVLNRITLVQLWKKIPILGVLDFVGTPGQMSNEDRALDAAGANDTIPYPHPPPKVKDGSDD
jgi:hypothetical protein